MSNMTEHMTELGRLRVAWREASRRKDAISADWADAAEQDAWDALVDFVELNGLANTEDDPRVVTP